jgi:hypothetical protein
MYTFAMSTFAAFSTSMREIQLEGDVANDGHFNIRLVRLLQETETNQTNVTDAVGVSDDGENGISIGYLFVIVVICSIGLCYLYCLYHTLRSWYIRRFGQGEETMLVTDSFRFLNSTQRLAVLERIFSDTSKVSLHSVLVQKQGGMRNFADLIQFHSPFLEARCPKATKSRRNAKAVARQRMIWRF